MRLRWDRAGLRERGMVRTRRLVLILFLALATVGFWLLASGISTVDFSQRNELPDLFSDADNADASPESSVEGPELPDLAPVIEGVGSIVLIVLLATGLLFYIWPEDARLLLRRYVTGALWLVAIIILVRYLEVTDFFDSLRTLEAATRERDAVSIPDFVRDPSLWLAFAVGSGLLLFLAAAAFVIYTRLAARLAPLAQIRFEAKETLEEIEAGADVRNAIIACYLNMCRVLNEKKRIRRQQGMTPREFAAQLADIGLPAGQVTRLTHLFESVRYGTHQFTDPEAREAIACLKAISEADVRPFGRTPGLPFLQAGSK